MQPPQRYCPSCGQSDGWVVSEMGPSCRYCPPAPQQLPPFTPQQQTQPIALQPLPSQNQAEIPVQIQSESVTRPASNFILIPSFIGGMLLLFSPTVSAKIRYYPGSGYSPYYYNWDYGCFDHIILGILLGPIGLLMMSIWWRSLQANKGNGVAPSITKIRIIAILSLVLLVIAIPASQVAAEEDLNPGESYDSPEPSASGVIVMICCLVLIFAAGRSPQPQAILHIPTPQITPLAVPQVSTQFLNQPQTQSTQVAQPIQSAHPLPVGQIQHNEPMVKTKSCPACFIINDKNRAICSACQHDFGRPPVERILWYSIVALIVIQIICTLFGLYVDENVLQLFAIITTMGQFIIGVFVIAEAPFLIGRALNAMGLESLGPEGGFSSLTLRIIIRVILVTLLLITWRYASIKFYITSDLLGLTKTAGAFLHTSYAFFALPIYGFIIAFLEMRFLIDLPKRSSFLSRIFDNDDLEKLWNGSAFIFLGLLIIIWKIKDLFSTGIFIGTVLSLIIAPLLMLFAIREVPRLIAAQTHAERRRLVVPLYLIVLVSLPVMFSLGIWNSGMNMIPLFNLSQQSAIGVNVAITDAIQLSELLENILLVSEILGAIFGLMLLIKFKDDALGIIDSTRKNIFIALGLAVLLILPLGWAVTASTVNSPNLFMRSWDATRDDGVNVILSEIIFYPADEGETTRIWWIFPAVVAGFPTEGDGIIDPVHIEDMRFVRAEVVPETGINMQYAGFPLGEYYYSQEWAGYSSNQALYAYVFDLEIEDGSHGGWFTFVLESDSMADELWLFAAIEHDGEFVDWSFSDNRATSSV